MAGLSDYFSGGGTYATDINQLAAQVTALSSRIDAMNPVGTVVFRMDDTNPADIYGGTWALLDANATVIFGNGATQDGSVIGSNSPTVPVPLHNHSMSHTHTRGSMEITGSFYPKWNVSNGFHALSCSGAFYNSSTRSGRIQGTDSRNGNAPVPLFRASRNWSGSTSQPSASNTGDKGTANATLDVRGAHIIVNAWQRTA